VLVDGNGIHLAKFKRNSRCIGNRRGWEDLNLAYIPVWETLADALRRLIAAGSTESGAKRDLCDAIADQAISVQLVFAADARLNLPELAVSAADFDVPARINPRDIDWKRSRPIKQWPLTARPPSEPMSLYLARAGPLLERKLGAIKVRTSEVTKVLCPTGSKVESNAAPRGRDRVARGGALSIAIRQAIYDLWPDGRPPKNRRAKERNIKIIEWLKSQNISVPGDPTRTIQRVLRELE
jgi:hypothetical protein